MASVRRAVRKASAAWRAPLQAHRGRVNSLVQTYAKCRAPEWAAALRLAAPRFPPWICRARRRAGRAWYRGWLRTRAGLALDAATASKMAGGRGAWVAYPRDGRLTWIVPPPLVVRALWCAQRAWARAVAALDGWCCRTRMAT